VPDSDHSLSASVLRFEWDMRSSIGDFELEVCEWAPSLDAVLNVVASRVVSSYHLMDRLELVYFNLVWLVNKVSRRYLYEELKKRITKAK
jgi:hypothetical protein